MRINVCHRVESTPSQQLEQTACSQCGKAVYCEVPQTGTPFCLQCVDPAIMGFVIVFVELLPNTFVAKSVEEVLTKKDATWHDAEWTYANMKC